MNRFIRIAGSAVVGAARALPAWAQSVKATPLGGKVRAGSKTEAFVKAVKVPVHVPLSGKTLEFDAAGNCTAGC